MKIVSLSFGLTHLLIWITWFNKWALKSKEKVDQHISFMINIIGIAHINNPLASYRNILYKICKPQWKRETFGDSQIRVMILKYTKKSTTETSGIWELNSLKTSSKKKFKLTWIAPKTSPSTIGSIVTNTLRSMKYHSGVPVGRFEKATRWCQKYSNTLIFYNLTVHSSLCCE